MKSLLSLHVLGIALILGLCAVGTAAAATTESGPQEVTLNRLANLFDAVTFDHAAHVEIAGDCATCHHHTTGDGAGGGRCQRCHATSQKSDTVACSSCHEVDPFSAAQLERQADDRYQYHVDKPTLKAAYHWNCCRCHEESGGPTGCTDCHQSNETGEQFYHSGKFAPKAETTPAHH